MNRICDKFNTFVNRHKLLTGRLIRQGFWYRKLCNSFKKFVKKYNAELSKYNVSKYKDPYFTRDMHTIRSKTLPCKKGHSLPRGFVDK